MTDPDPVRSLAVLTTGRQDWGVLRSTCVAIRDETDVRLDVVAGGTHRSAARPQAQPWPAELAGPIPSTMPSDVRARGRGRPTLNGSADSTRGMPSSSR